MPLTVNLTLRWVRRLLSRGAWRACGQRRLLLARSSASMRKQKAVILSSWEVHGVRTQTRRQNPVGSLLGQLGGHIAHDPGEAPCQNRRRQACELSAEPRRKWMESKALKCHSGGILLKDCDHQTREPEEDEPVKDGNMKLIAAAGGHPLDFLGHRASCSWTGISGRRGLRCAECGCKGLQGKQETAWPPQFVCAQHGLGSLPLFSGRYVAVDTTLVSALQGNGESRTGWTPRFMRHRLEQAWEIAVVRNLMRRDKGVCRISAGLAGCPWVGRAGAPVPWSSATRLWHSVTERQ